MPAKLNDVLRAVRDGITARPAVAPVLRAAKRELRGNTPQDSIDDIAEAVAVLGMAPASLTADLMRDAVNVIAPALASLTDPQKDALRAALRRLARNANTLPEVAATAERIKRLWLGDLQASDQIEADMTAALAILRNPTDAEAVRAALDTVRRWRDMTPEDQQ